MIKKNKIAILAGMPRAATTFLYHNFNLHPEIFVPYRRKTNYFSLHNDSSEDWFLSHFKDMPKGSFAVDTETLAFVNTNIKSPMLIKQFNKNAKIILCVRDPAEWVVSFYKQISTFENNLPSFEKFLSGHYTLVEDGRNIVFNMDAANINNRIKEYKNLFPKTILILKFKDLTKSPVESLKKIEQFLGVTSFYDVSNVISTKINSSNRVHNKYLNKFLRNELIIKLMKNVLPKKFIVFIRLKFDYISSNYRGLSKINSKKDEYSNMIKLAKKYYQSKKTKR